MIYWSSYIIYIDLFVNLYRFKFPTFRFTQNYVERTKSILDEL